MEKQIRIQLNKKELWILRNLLARDYHVSRRNIKYAKKRMARGEPDSITYPIADRERNLKFTQHLLKKLSKPLDVKWFYQ